MRRLLRLVLLAGLTLQVGLGVGASTHRAPNDAAKALAMAAALGSTLCLPDGEEPAGEGSEHPGCCWSHGPATAEVPVPAGHLLFPPRPLRMARRRLSPLRRAPSRRAVPLSDISPGAPPHGSA